MSAFALIAAAALSCIAVDGDTLRCGAERVRLIGIDAPEMPGHCRLGRNCAPGDPEASKAALAHLVDGRPVTLDRHGRDAYRRTLAFAFVGEIELSCAQIRAGHAVYVARWDVGGRLSRC
jgi:micrococcal nuclease